MQHAAEHAPAGRDATPIRVLVLDDEEGIRRVVKHALTRAGFEVETAANGRQGLQMLLTRIFDVTVVDLRMHEMDGITFVQEARKIWPWQGFVICSGFIDDRFGSLAHAEGIETILEKPVDVERLVAAVRHEAHRPHALEQPTGSGLTRRLIAHQLNIMRHLSRDILHSQNLLNALIRLGQAIHDMMPFNVMGALAADEDGALLLLQSHAPQPESAFSQMQRYVTERYQALAGRRLDTSTLRVERVGPPPVTTAGRTLPSITSVPVINGDAVEGILALGSFTPHAFDDANVALLYQAASTLSTLSAALREMKQMATRDPLTGLYNRRHLDEELDRAWRLSMRYNHPVAVLMLDMDRLKEVNDRWGHDAGDQAIRVFAETLNSATRATDMLARYGGDEFVILLQQAGRNEAGILAERVLATVRSARMVREAPGHSLTCSIGIAIFEPGDVIAGPGELITRADQALYQAKHADRDRYTFWSADTPENPAAEMPFSATTCRGSILLVDDEEYVIQVLTRILEQDGYQVASARSVTEAIEALKPSGKRPDILVCDVALPDGDGVEVMRRAREVDDTVVIVVLTGNATADNAIAALREGAFDFIQKPVRPDTLTALMKRAMQYRSMNRENMRYRGYLEEMVRAKKNELTKALDEIKTAYQFTLETMVAMLDAREFETGQHSVRVRDLTLFLAGRMGIEGEQLEEIGRGALLHDIGKIGIPDAILLKPGKLTDDEWEVMRRHPEIGYRFLRNSAFLQTAAGVVLSHHERWDGAGYPHGIKGEDINIGARIFSVIDAYDAMRSSRVYKASISRDEAVEEIRREAGRQFDPAVVEAFIACVDELEAIGGWARSFA